VRRVVACPRPDWQNKVEAAGLNWHTLQQPHDRPYWNESAFYEFTAKEIGVLADATNQLAEMSLAAAQRIIDRKQYAQMGIPESAVPLIEASWDAEPPSLYGRFDLAYDGSGPPKLLEYNADTPTSLLEAAVVQWYWLEDTRPRSDQFNSIHERLIAQWKELAPSFPGPHTSHDGADTPRHIDFCCADDSEDRMTVTYLLDTAQQAGLSASSFLIDEIGWDGVRFVAPDGRPLTAVFKLYPWEWMVREEFAKHLDSGVIWVEPPWKMLLSNKGLLPVLWELYPGHPNLLAAGWTEPSRDTSWVKKPLLGREGANVTLRGPTGDLATAGDYGEEGFVYQDLAPLASFDGKYPVIGSWVIGHEPGDVAAGIGIRESDMPITTNLSQFVPHLIRQTQGHK
jgi:glutathionylspermidine synthase